MWWHGGDGEDWRAPGRQRREAASLGTTEEEARMGGAPWVLGACSSSSSELLLLGRGRCNDEGRQGGDSGCRVARRRRSGRREERARGLPSLERGGGDGNLQEIHGGRLLQNGGVATPSEGAREKKWRKEGEGRRGWSCWYCSGEGQRVVMELRHGAAATRVAGGHQREEEHGGAPLLRIKQEGEGSEALVSDEAGRRQQPHAGVLGLLDREGGWEG